MVPPAYELALCSATGKSAERFMITAAQLRQVTLDMSPLEVGQLKLTYVARHILIEVGGKLWARVIDIEFMKLHSMASQGAGEFIHAGEGVEMR
jgi:hypothetical protein